MCRPPLPKSLTESNQTSSQSPGRAVWRARSRAMQSLRSAPVYCRFTSTVARNLTGGWALKSRARLCCERIDFFIAVQIGAQRQFGQYIIGIR